MATEVLDSAVLDSARIEELMGDGVDLDDLFVVLSLAAMSVERLRHSIDRGAAESLSTEERRYLVRGVESLRSQADAAAVDAARGLEASGHERDAGYFSTAAWLRHFLGLSSVESRVRMQVVRLFEAPPDWERAA
ncbi:MAG: hypothetical protein AAGG08_07635, partial [Actinomycetota bacterium]